MQLLGWANRTADVSFGQLHVKSTGETRSVGLLGGRGGIYLGQCFNATDGIQVVAVEGPVACVDVVGAGDVG